LGQVALLASQQAIDDAKDLHDFLIASGLRQEEIKNGRVAMTRIYCCGGLMEKIAFTFLTA
jgi:hypothetical protein